MNIIFISRPHRQPVRRSLHAPRHFLALGAVAAVALSAAVGAGYAVGRWQQAGDYVSAWQARLAEQHEALADVREQSRNEIRALSAEMAELQSRMTRIDALGRKLVSSSLVDADEFDFGGSSPGRGGVQLNDRATEGALPDLRASIDALGERMGHREHQLGVLEDVMMERQLAEAATPAGSPVTEGWMSSSYGTRKDPFTGEEAFHAGVDFAGREGSEIHAVGAGVVTYAGKRWGYGQLVEITHGDGYVTRYGHNDEIMVDEGEMVRRGDLISTMGSTGRSTGPHVHMEVLKEGEPVNPWKYVQAGS